MSDLRQALAQPEQEPDEFCTATTEELMKELGCSDEKAKKIHDKVEALAQPEQEPVAHLWECIGRWTAMIAHDGEDANLSPPDWLVDAVKAATAPPKREWVGLTGNEQDTIVRMANDSLDAICLTEDKLKEKNT